MHEDDWVIRLQRASKSYSLERNPWRRLWSQLRRTTAGPQHHALQPLDLTIRRGEVVGVIGRNGAGKSTLLQLVCGVLEPTTGQRQVRGRVAALLELGAGFNPELTGRENVRLNGPLMGMNAEQVEQRLPEIVEFAGIGEFIDQPVRSYSSGMFMRLAFSMATSFDPEILIIDEALSVGDGSFGRKSFERIMALKERGATILFCSHSMFSVEQFCTRALWLESGELRFDGPAHQATVQYTEWLEQYEQGKGTGGHPAAQRFDSPSATLLGVELAPPAEGTAYRNGIDDWRLRIRLRSDPALPPPTVGVLVHGADTRVVTSAGNWVDGCPLQAADAEHAELELTIPRLPLLKGRYTVSVYVLCERSIHVQAMAEHVLGFEVVQDHPEQGVVSLPRSWRKVDA